MLTDHSVERYPGTRQQFVEEVIEGLSQQERTTVHVRPHLQLTTAQMHNYYSSYFILCLGFM